MLILVDISKIACVSVERSNRVYTRIVFKMQIRLHQIKSLQSVPSDDTVIIECIFKFVTMFVRIYFQRAFQFAKVNFAVFYNSRDILHLIYYTICY